MFGSVYYCGETVDAAQVCVGGLSRVVTCTRGAVESGWCECGKKKYTVESGDVEWWYLWGLLVVWVVMVFGVAMLSNGLGGFVFCIGP